MNPLRIALLTGGLLLAFAWAQPAHAQARFGLRGGATIDPDQVHFGFHVRPPVLSPHVRIRPSFEIGFGDDRTVAAFQADLVYEFHEGNLRPYAGAGPALVLVDRDAPPGRDDSDFEAGLNLVGGLEWGPAFRYLVELRAGVGDIPELKFTFGVTFF